VAHYSEDFIALMLWLYKLMLFEISQSAVNGSKVQNVCETRNKNKIFLCVK